ncbi:MAG: hypothetical protein ABEL51_16560 [Salinibacter sp.]
MKILRGPGGGRSRFSDPGQIREVKQAPSSEWSTKHLYAATELPSIAAGDRFFRQILLVPFPTKLSAEKTEEELARRFGAERDGILRWALKGLGRVLESGGFPSRRPPEETRRRWEALSGPIGRFKAGLLEVTGAPEDVIAKEELYSTYREFCRKEGILAETKDTFTRTLTEDQRIRSAKRIPEPNGNQVRCYVGVKPREG